MFTWTPIIQLLTWFFKKGSHSLTEVFHSYSPHSHTLQTTDGWMSDDDPHRFCDCQPSSQTVKQWKFNFKPLDSTKTLIAVRSHRSFWTLLFDNCAKVHRVILDLESLRDLVFWANHSLAPVSKLQQIFAGLVVDCYLRVQSERCSDLDWVVLTSTLKVKSWMSNSLNAPEVVVWSYPTIPWFKSIPKNLGRLSPVFKPG